MLRNPGFTALLLFALPAMVTAQNTGKLAGLVVDGSDGTGLPGATVVIEGTLLGAATDADGNYFILGVPVGTYNIRASFVGYQTVTETSVEISTGYTREINFELQPGVELDEIIVEYERPLIQKDAIGVPRVVTSGEIEKLPVRGVTNVAKLQSGVVSDDGEDEVFVRGGREQQIVYYIDGVKATLGEISVPQQAIQEQEMLIGTIPARYGDIMSGVISITTKSGASTFFGSAEAITSAATDDFGYNLASISIGGPIKKDKASFFVAVEFLDQADADPWAINTLQLSDDALALLQQSPQVLQLVNPETGEKRYVPLPGDLAPSTPVSEIGNFIDIPEGFELGQDGRPITAPTIYTEERFERKTDKRMPYSRWNATGNVRMNLAKTVSLRLGGSYISSENEGYNFGASLYNPDRFQIAEQNTYRLFGTLLHYVSSSTFYQVQAEFSNSKFWSYSNGFSRDVRDLFFYGDIDHPVNATLKSYRICVEGEHGCAEDGVYEQAYRDGNLVAPGRAAGLFQMPGYGSPSYDKRHDQQFRVSVSATTQLGVHQIELGGEFEQRTERRYTMDGTRAGELARFFADESGPESAEEGVSRYEDLSPSTLLSRAQWYGYDLYGLKEVDDQDVDAFGASENFNVAPYKPIYYGGYIADKIEFKDLVINLGFRAEVFDNNTLILRDVNATVPLIRVENLTPEEMANVPNNIGDDYKVYFSGQDIVGYGSLNGLFFGAGGEQTNFTDLSDRGGAPKQRPGSQQLSSEVFKDYKPQFTFMPRIGVSFPVTDQALFFASYNVTSQRPSERQFRPFSAYDERVRGTLSEPALLPEKTTQYELGFRQRVGARAALQISGFFRQQKNMISERESRAFPVDFTTFRNVDFATIKGFELQYDLRRTKNISLLANYTFSVARATGSDARTVQLLREQTALGDYFPNFLSTAVFDQRHKFNIVLDYRLGEGEGPEFLGGRPLSNFGFNLVATIGSGNPYSALSGSKTAVARFVEPLDGDINGARMPWNNRVDLRIDRRFKVGPGNNSITVFLWIENLLNQENIYGVWRATGLPDVDGFLETAEGLQVIQNAGDIINDPLGSESLAFNYSTYSRVPTTVSASRGAGAFSGGRPYGLPRRTRLGVRLNY